MYQLPFITLRNSEQFLETFKDELNAHLKRDITIEPIVATDFQKNIVITMYDGSEFKLNYAFYIEKKVRSYEEDETLFAVFTEHCGYFLFYGEMVKSIV